MTNYRRSNENQRYNQELRDAIKQELEVQYALLAAARRDLQKAYDKLITAAEIDEDDLDQSSGLFEARYAIRSAINRFGHRVQSTPTETYIGNVAAFMSPEKAAELKEKYRAG